MALVWSVISARWAARPDKHPSTSNELMVGTIPIRDSMSDGTEDDGVCTGHLFTPDEFSELFTVRTFRRLASGAWKPVWVDSCLEVGWRSTVKGPS
jgi:hypothetical protein